jgi:hypothetical protein
VEWWGPKTRGERLAASCSEPDEVLNAIDTGLRANNSTIVGTGAFAHTYTNTGVQLLGRRCTILRLGHVT